MKHTTIKQVRKSLAMWGLFWARQEMGSGFGSKSTTARICETLQTEVYTSSSLYQFSHLSDNMHEPEHIKEIGDAIAKLSSKCRQAISNKYIKGDEINNYYTIEAENSLLGMI